jgi:folate-dependent tRNA-U54 methylase TrmFO/GidA
MGALARHVSGQAEKGFAPMNVTFGLIDDASVPPSRDKAKRREEIARRAREAIEEWRLRALPGR